MYVELAWVVSVGEGRSLCETNVLMLVQCNVCSICGDGASVVVVVTCCDSFHLFFFHAHGFSR